MTQPWEADPSAVFVRRLGESPQALGTTSGKDGCPDLWELSNGDVAVIGRDLTDVLRGRLPEEASVRADERIVVIPGETLRSAKPDIADA
ncbi:hypothetical protein [Streptomyces sp. NPDC050560]|uniref:hypothetical protein n=1 Tax=Streptomyces sp. NPDC050560 TaxID=3365630 RepID=UPI0037B660CC